MADLSITPAQVLKSTGASTVTEDGTAGETFTAGQTAYLRSSDSRLMKAYNLGTSEQSSLRGIALHGAAAGQPLRLQTDGDLNIGAATTRQTFYMLSTTPGGICPQADVATTGKRLTYVGYARDVSGAFTILKANTGLIL
jgi:hypothetical protein